MYTHVSKCKNDKIKGERKKSKLYGYFEKIIKKIKRMYKLCLRKNDETSLLISHTYFGTNEFITYIIKMRNKEMKFHSLFHW
jgi:hypothetical protein